MIWTDHFGNKIGESANKIRKSRGFVMFDRWFLAHPRAVNENYLEHQAVALSFSFVLFAAACACFIHALVPGLFQRTGSTMVARLYEAMVTKRVRQNDTAVDSSFAAFDVGL
jgi:uncharacterized protein DUF6356